MEKSTSASSIASADATQKKTALRRPREPRLPPRHDDERGRDGLHVAVGRRQGARRGDPIVDALFFRKRPQLRLVLVAYGENGKRVFIELVPKRDQIRYFFATRRAPGRPEHQQHPLALKTAQGHCFAIERGRREVGGFYAFPLRKRVVEAREQRTAAQPREHDASGQNGYPRFHRFVSIVC
jgi:hypothetical protein